MVQKIIGLPDTKIRESSKEITSFDMYLEKIIKDLIETSEIQKDPPALGMAAPQIEVFKRVFVAKIRNKFRPFLNPSITKYSKRQSALLEGCFSVLGLFGQVTRPAEIDVEYQDRHGKKITKHFKGIAAKIIQHEFDHLNGTLFIDKAKDVVELTQDEFEHEQQES